MQKEHSSEKKVMIKNIVFDLGNVLVEFDPIAYLNRIGFSEQEAFRLSRMIFKDPRWNEFDRGTITIEQYAEQLKLENPSDVESINKIFSSNWCSNMFKEKTTTSSALIALSKSYNIYVLSNVSKLVLDYIKTLDFWRYVTSGTYSYVQHFCKPEAEIYQLFIDEHGLIPNECLFLDDKEENIQAAIKFGMHGMIFSNQNINDIKECISNLDM